MDTKNNPPLERKPYNPPSLVTYGDLSRITRTVDASGKDDGSGNKGSMSKTG